MLHTVIDASSKTPAGVLDGTLSSYGDYDQCLALGHDARFVAPFAGQHCMIKLDPNFKSNNNNMHRSLLQIERSLEKTLPIFEYYYINVGLCVPASCSVEDVSSLVTRSEYHKIIIMKGTYCSSQTLTLRSTA